MGLDMYMTGDKYLGHYDKDEKKLSEKVRQNAKVAYQVSGITINLMYWRKAYGIHKWLVEHVQEGVDDCRKYLVPREQLQQLKKDCETQRGLIEDSITDYDQKNYNYVSHGRG